MPCMLQSAFATAGRGKFPQVYVFDKKEERIFRTAPANILHERDFNRYNDGKYIICMEDGLGKIEDQAAPVFKRIAEDRSLVGLTLEDRVKVMAFVALQQVRGPSTRINMIDVAEKMRERVRSMGHDPEEVPQLRGMDDPEMVKFIAMNLASKNLPEFTKIISTKMMLLIGAAPGTTFLLGDHPVVKANTNQNGVLGSLGLTSEGIEIYLPIAPDLLLAFWCPTLVHFLEVGLKQSEESYHNTALIALLGVGSEADLLRKERANLGASIEALRADLDAIRNQKPLISNAKSMEYYNSLQVIYAERRVISATGDFALASNMIAGNNNLRSGPRLELL
nr:DUF4238 domain-containing protein [Brevundimonas sp.]